MWGRKSVPGKFPQIYYKLGEKWSNKDFRWCVDEHFDMKWLLFVSFLWLIENCQSERTDKKTVLNFVVKALFFKRWALLTEKLSLFFNSFCELFIESFLSPPVTWVKISRTFYVKFFLLIYFDLLKISACINNFHGCFFIFIPFLFLHQKFYFVPIKKFKEISINTWKKKFSVWKNHNFLYFYWIIKCCITHRVGNKKEQSKMP